MRKDIEIHINPEDIVLVPMSSRIYSDFEWLDEVPEGQAQEHIYGEVTVSSNIHQDKILSTGVFVEIPYTPVAWPIKIRIKRRLDNGAFDDPLYNPVNSSEWFDVEARLFGGDAAPINASELMVVNKDKYYLHFELTENEPIRYTGKVMIYADSELDFNIRRVDHQNSNLLLKCIPGNNYRYPLSGVGLIRWTNGAINQSKLAEIIQREFGEDGVIIHTAKYNDVSQSLAIDANFDDLD